MRIGIVLIIAGVLTLIATTANTGFLARSEQVTSVTKKIVDGILIEGTKTTTNKYDLANINTLVLETFSGDIDVEIGDSMSSLGEFEIKEKSNDSRGVKQKSPVFERQGNVLILRAVQTSCLNCSISYRVKLGKAMGLELRGSNGEITVIGLSNSIKARSINGGIIISNTGKTVLDLESNNGEITLENLALMANSQNKIRTNNSDIVLRLENGSGVRLSGTTGNGSFVANHADLKMNSERGSFEATLSGDNPAQLELYSGNGDITLE